MQIRLDVRSSMGYCFMLNGATVYWQSKRQPVVALSVSEDEFISASSMIQEVMYPRKLLENPSCPQSHPTTVFADNKTCISWPGGSVGRSERAKRIDLHIGFVHDAAKDVLVKYHNVNTKVNAADILTKLVTDG